MLALPPEAIYLDLRRITDDLWYCYCLVTKSSLTLCGPMDCSLPGSSVVGFSGQEYWNGVPFSSPEDLSDPGIKPTSPALQTDALPSEPPGKPIVPNV